MKKHFLIFCLCLSFAAFANAQNKQQDTIDYTTMRCFYKLDYAPLFTRDLYRYDTMALDVGKSVCKFYSYYNSILIPLINETYKKQGNLGNLPKSSENNYIIYINYPQNKITVEDRIKGDFNTDYEYSENLEYQHWTLIDETCNILDYKCSKATCKYAGREYVAWYTKEIPVNVGPYKFGGLPGLIMKIVDNQNNYIFECIGIEKTKIPIVKEKSNLVKISKEKFFKTDIRNHKNPKAAMLASFKSMGMGTKDLEEKLKSVPNREFPYNPIELEY